MLLRPRDHHPPGAVAGDAVGLRQAVEGEAEQIGRDGRHGDVHRIVEQDAVVDLVAEHQQRVLARDVGDALERLARVHRSRRVVRVDDDDRLRAIGDPRADVLEIRVPAVVLIADVVHRRTAREARHRGPQRVVRRGDQHLVALVEKGLHRHRDELGDAVAEEDVLGVDVREARDLLVPAHDRATRGEDAAALAVAVRGRDGGDHVADDLVRRLEAEDRRVARVELQDRVTCGLEPSRLIQGGAADLVEDVLQLRGLVERPQPAAAERDAQVGVGHRPRI